MKSSTKRFFYRLESNRLTRDNTVPKSGLFENESIQSQIWLKLIKSFRFSFRRFENNPSKNLDNIFLQLIHIFIILSMSKVDPTFARIYIFSEETKFKMFYCVFCCNIKFMSWRHCSTKNWNIFELKYQLDILFYVKQHFCFSVFKPVVWKNLGWGVNSFIQSISLVFCSKTFMDKNSYMYLYSLLSKIDKRLCTLFLKIYYFI